MSSHLRLTFLTSAPDVDGLPRSTGEVAVIGRSNVGKSSLLNALANNRNVAKVSSKPGRTTLLNTFQVDGSTSTLVDLPGYGYAATASKQERAAWDRRMRTYLTARDALRLVLVLVDGAVGPTALDQEMLAWLRAHDRPLRVVATKHDKVKPSQRERRKRDLAAGCQLEPADVLWASATTRHGIPAVAEVIRRTLQTTPA